MSNVINSTTSEFEEKVLKSEVPVLIDFWAPWCGPCKMLAPILDEISTSRTDIKIVKINVDEEPELAQKFGVRGIPAMNIVINGKVEASKVGALSKGQLDAWLNNTLN